MRTSVRHDNMMLSTKLKEAARKMFFLPEEEVAKAMGVQVRTVRRWLKRSDFRAELRQLQQEYRQAAARFASRQARDAALKLGELIENRDPKVLLDTLKASGAFEYQDAADADGGLDAILEKLAAVDEDKTDV